MKTQTNIALILFAAVIAWLYYASSLKQTMSLQRIQLDREVLAAKKEAIQNAAPSTNIVCEYSIINDPNGMTYLLNKRSGESWRWYRNLKKDSLTEFDDEGWTPVNFDVAGLKFATASEAQDFNVFWQNTQREKRFEKQTLGAESAQSASESGGVNAVTSTSREK